MQSSYMSKMTELQLCIDQAVNHSDTMFLQCHFSSYAECHNTPPTHIHITNPVCATNWGPNFIGEVRVHMPLEVPV